MKTYIKDFVAGALVREFFLLAKKETAVTRTGKPYLKLTLVDKTGEIRCNAWDLAETAVLVDEFCKVEAVVDSYEGALQLKVSRIRPAANNDPIDIADFFPCSERDRATMLSDLEHNIGTLIDNENLRSMLLAMLRDNDIRPLLLEAPAAVSIHHAYRGGLLEHILSLVNASVNIAAAYPELDRDLLIAASFLHDIGKLQEMEFSRATRYTVRGRLMGHIAMGLGTIQQFCGEFPIPEDLQEKLYHMVLSHHGTNEWGSPVLPAFREAVVFHFLDQIDAKLAAITAAEKIAGADEDMTYVKGLGANVVLCKALPIADEAGA